MLQFSLKTLLLMTFLAAMGCGVFFVLPIRFASLVFLGTTLALAAPLVAAVVYGRDFVKAFAVGALTAYGAWMLSGIPVVFVIVVGFEMRNVDKSVGNIWELLLKGTDEAMVLRLFAMCWPLVLVAGLLGIAIRWWTLRRSSQG